MELWVRSQDKEALLKVNNGLMYWEDTDKRNCVVIKETSTNLSVLGAYKTKERALEVLNEIQRLITDLQYMSYAIPNNKFTGYRPNVYEMPEK